MRILFVSSINDRSEASLIEYLANSGDDVTLIANPEDPNLLKFERLGVHVIPYKVANRIDLRAAFRIRQLCFRKGIETAYSSFNAGISATLIGCIGLKTRVVAYRGTMGNLSRLDPSSYLTHLNPRLNGIVANCEAVKNSLIEYGINKSKIKVILKGHGTDWYQTSTPPSRESLGIKDEELIIGLVANMRPLKGIETLIEAAKFLMADHKFKILLVGEERDSELRDLVHKYELNSYVKFLGYRDDAASFAALFDIAVLTSNRREGVARSIVEAMSHGKPCIVTNIGGLPEAVIHGKNGIIVQPNNSKELAGALKELLSNPGLRASYGQASKKRFNEVFSLNRYHTEMRAFFCAT